MHIENHPNLKSAIEAATKAEKRYSFERHELKAGEGIPWHSHPEADEIIVADEGLFWLAEEKQRELFWFEEGKGAKVIFLPRRKRHALISITGVAYLVYKTKIDEIEHCKGPNLKNELKRILSRLLRKYGDGYRKEE